MPAQVKGELKYCFCPFSSGQRQVLLEIHPAPLSVFYWLLIPRLLVHLRLDGLVALASSQLVEDHYFSAIWPFVPFDRIPTLLCLKAFPTYQYGDRGHVEEVGAVEAVDEGVQGGCIQYAGSVVLETVIA